MAKIIVVDGLSTALVLSFLAKNRGWGSTSVIGFYRYDMRMQNQYYFADELVRHLTIMNCLVTFTTRS
ncbi:hypothetical protein ACVRXI_02095 [Streptococcus ovis]